MCTKRKKNQFIEVKDNLLWRAHESFVKNIQVLKRNEHYLKADFDYVGCQIY
jgi:hypothetical protein